MKQELLELKVQLLWKILGCYVLKDYSNFKDTLYYKEPVLSSSGISFEDTSMKISSKEFKILAEEE